MIVAIGFVTMALGVNARTAFSLLFPPIIEEFGSTVPVHPGFAVRVDQIGNLVITKEGAR